MAEISTKKVALSGILICSMELTKRKKSDMLVDKTENEGCLRNQKFKGGFVMTELQVKTKKGSLKKFFAMFLAVCVCFTTIHVNGAFAQAAESNPTISLSKTTLEMKVGAKETLTATALKDEVVGGEEIVSGGETIVSGGETIISGGETQSKPQEVEWVCADKAVKITPNGKTVSVEALAVGNATITAKVKGTDVKATCSVKVSAADEGGKVINPTGVTLDKKTLALDLNGAKTGTLKATVVPAGAKQTVTWLSSDPSVASVKDGAVTALKVGKTNITATVPNTKLTATCAVEVKDSTPAKEDPKPSTPTKKTVKVKKVVPTTKTVYVVAGKKVTVGATVEPGNATSKKITWSTAKKSVASVKAGKNGASVTITAGKKAAGKKTTVTAKAGGKSAKVTVNVVKKATKVKSVTLKDAKVNVGETVALQPTYNPKKATISKITWKTSSKKVATVSNGIVTGKKAGVATITVKADNKSAKCVVSVSKKNTTLTLKKTSGTVKVGKTIKIEKKKIGKGDSIKSYTSSNKKVATVTKKGVVKGVKKGNAVITVQTKKGAVATFKVTVKKK